MTKKLFVSFAFTIVALVMGMGSASARYVSDNNDTVTYVGSAMSSSLDTPPLPAATSFQPTTVTAPYTTLDYHVTAGPNGAFAYCDRGRLAYNPCSEAYFAPGTVISVQIIPIQLPADGQWYWMTILYNQGNSFRAYIPHEEVVG
jgi:hypothetical protein